MTIYIEWLNVLLGKHLGVDPDHWPLVGEQYLSLSPLILYCGMHLYTAVNRPPSFLVILTVPCSGLVSSEH